MATMHEDSHCALTTIGFDNDAVRMVIEQSQVHDPGFNIVALAKEIASIIETLEKVQTRWKGDPAYQAPWQSRSWRCDFSLCMSSSCATARKPLRRQGLSASTT